MSKWVEVRDAVEKEIQISALLAEGKTMAGLLIRRDADI